MDLAIFIIVIVVLIGLFIFLRKWEYKIKTRYKDKAADLLDMGDPNPTEVRETIRCLRLYSGRIKKDKEAVGLVSRLQSKYGHLL